MIKKYFHNKRIIKPCIFLFKIIIIIFIVWFLFHKNYLKSENFYDLLQAKNIPYILISLAAFLISQILASFRLFLLLSAINYPLSFKEIFKLIFIGNFFNNLLPGIIGGDIIKGYYLVKDEKNKKGKSAGIILMDRALGILALMFTGLIAIIFLLLQSSIMIGGYKKILYTLLIIISSIFILVIFYLILGRFENIRIKMKKLFKKIFRKTILYYMTESLGLFVKNFRILSYAFLISLLIHLISVIGVINFINIFNEDIINIPIFMAISYIIMLLGIVPVTPGNVGWTELLAAFGWSAAGSNVGAKVFIYWRIVAILCSLLGGFFYILKKNKIKMRGKNEKINEA